MTRDDIICMAREAGSEAFKYPSMISEEDWQVLERFAQLIAAAEREECAKVCDKIDKSHWGCEIKGTWCSEAIRARNKQ